MALRVLVPSEELASALQLPGIEPILWHLNNARHEAPEAEVLITERPRELDRRRAVARIPGLRHVHLLSLGFDWVLEHLPDGVGLSNSRGAIEDATAEHALALLLAALRVVPAAVRDQDMQRWNPAWSPTLYGATVLLLGYGGVGAGIAARLAPFGPARVLPVGRTARTEPDGTAVHALHELPGLLPEADIVVIALPHDASTERLVDAAFLSRMRDGALLVNIGRGPVVDTDALLTELATGRLGVALDVTDPEPLPPGHRLWNAPNCLITPHIGGNTRQVLEFCGQLAVQQMQRLAAGRELLNVVRSAGQ
ncbi:NAD(P)-dependent oxidoreductase [Glutamicibacter uratoxydans]|uniref:NAD(P)-dependent oxidoreductase n=1 Tax=Glutamicibacter uratoxydans TaxID=43667 RepID=UPI003D6F70A4